MCWKDCIKMLNFYQESAELAFAGHKFYSREHVGNMWKNFYERVFQEEEEKGGAESRHMALDGSVILWKKKNSSIFKYLHCTGTGRHGIVYLVRHPHRYFCLRRCPGNLSWTFWTVGSGMFYFNSVYSGCDPYSSGSHRLPGGVLIFGPAWGLYIIMWGFP